jgi:lysozyme
MKTSINGLNLIKQFEGCKLTSYLCPAQKWTIGYGNTFINGKPVTEGMKITQAQADNLLIKSLAEYETQIDYYRFSGIQQNQFDALVSLIYNIGAGALKRSNLPNMIRVNPYSININTEWERFVYAKGMKLPGLVRRRKAELELYFKK